MTIAAEQGTGTLPHRVLFHVVAARYGTTPARVRAWPVDDYMDAIHFLRLTGGR